jgi:hypothetical protein
MDRAEATLPDGFSVAAVPELSTWAMLLIGFAGLGLWLIDGNQSCIDSCDSIGRRRRRSWLCAEYERQLGGGSPLPSLMAAKG